MGSDFRELARRLGDHAEAVCAHYLSNGRRHGRYWLVGDVHNTPGRSLYVRLVPAYGGPAGKWAEYVAALIMLPTCEDPPACGETAFPMQHNSRALREVA